MSLRTDLPPVAAVEAVVHDLRRTPGLDPEPVAVEEEIAGVLTFTGALAGLQRLEDELPLGVVAIDPVPLGEIVEIERAVGAEREPVGHFKNCRFPVVPDAQDLFETDSAARVLGQGPARIGDAGLGGSGDREAEQERWEEN